MNYILCHGLGEGPEQWEGVMEKAAVPICCPALFEGVGEAPLTYGVLYSTFEAYCNAQRGKLNLCGLSLGGVLALAYASAHPEAVASLILIGTPYKIPRFAFAFQNIVFRLLPGRAFERMGLTKGNAICLMKSVSQLDIPKIAAGINCRTLILCGEKDKTNLESARLLHSRIDKSRFAIIKNAGHQVNTDEPDALAAEINDFWRQGPIEPHRPE